jgi:hypothetical protein
VSTISGKIMFLGTRTQPERKADNLAAICEPFVSMSYNAVGLHELLRG